MKEYGEYTTAGTIRFERLLPGPIERVWKYLTDAEHRSKWLAGGAMDLHEGGAVQLVFDHDRLTPHDDPVPDRYQEYEGETIMDGRIVEIDPPNLLTYTWGEESGSDSIVTFELTPKGDQVLLILVHRRLGNDTDLLAGVGAGWHTHLGILDDKLHGRVPDPFWPVHVELVNTYSERLEQVRTPE